MSEEVHKAIKTMNGLKAPGPDGILGIFYKSQWDIIKDKLVEFIQCLFQDSSKVSLINDTFIALIPKIAQPNLISQFRPIGLCYIDYKIISKILASRI